MFADICTGLISILTPETIGAVALGIFTGLMFGAIPGISGIMAISILLPLTFYVSPLVGIPMLLGIYKASMFGGSITAVLLNTPGARRPSAPLWTATPSPSRAKRARASTRRWSARCSGTRSATSCLTLRGRPPVPISPSSRPRRTVQPYPGWP